MKANVNVVGPKELLDGAPTRRLGGRLQELLAAAKITDCTVKLQKRLKPGKKKPYSITVKQGLLEGVVILVQATAANNYQIVLSSTVYDDPRKLWYAIKQAAQTLGIKVKGRMARIDDEQISHEAETPKPRKTRGPKSTPLGAKGRRAAMPEEPSILQHKLAELEAARKRVGELQQEIKHAEKELEQKKEELAQLAEKLSALDQVEKILTP